MKHVKNINKRSKKLASLFALTVSLVFIAALGFFANDIFNLQAVASNPGHDASGISPGTFDGAAAGVFTFPGSINLGSVSRNTWPSGGDSDWTISGADMYSGVTGNVGVGDNTPTEGKLVVRGTGTGVYSYGVTTGYWGGSNTGNGILATSVSGAGIWGGSVSSNGIYGTTCGNASSEPAAIKGINSGTSAGHQCKGYGVEGISERSYGVYGESTNETGVVGKGVYGVLGVGTSYDFYASGGGTNYGPFTGGHEAKLTSDFPEEVKRGMIVSVTGETQIRNDESGTVSISSTLPTVKLSSKSNDKAVFGVLVSESPLQEDHWYNASDGERFAIVNALGEGRALVSNANGNIQVGDYITTSSISGYGQRQDDDLLHSYTLGKAIETVDWDSVTETMDFSGNKYKIYLIGVVYTSG